MLASIFANIDDPLLMDRIRIEFAGLCNQILSADGIVPQDANDLIKVWKKAAGYLNMAIERRAGKDIAQAISIIKNYPLSIIFRIGFGLALKTKWEAQKWLSSAWFINQGFDTSFWGEYWGAMIEGLSKKRPLFYDKTNQELRDFESLNDLMECVKILRYVMVTDGLLECIEIRYKCDPHIPDTHDVTFLYLIFDFWARHILGLEPSFHGITLSQAKELLSKLRQGETSPPYKLPKWKEKFIDHMISIVESPEEEALMTLKEALSSIWFQFVEEYEMVRVDDLDPRFSKFILINA
jgi:hypothetical protein